MFVGHFDEGGEKEREFFVSRGKLKARNSNFRRENSHFDRVRTARELRLKILSQWPDMNGKSEPR
jgi:hypothetical protein